ncbi:heme-binding domain-containing protein [Pedobacter alpinus]|uniref:Heme-binding domain-containing protein n=1 Tax=Pedobacter alpinus TaxID=1590643 RepID=A0ABW5TMM2_9SPHI
MVKKILIVTAIFLVLIQFVKSEKNIAEGAQPNAITTKYLIPDSVQQILKVACYDCHSNNTKYPWYSAIQPVAWWLNDHVKDGKKHLNFDEFTTYTLKRQDHKLEEVIETQEDRWMPLESYSLIHGDAKLSETQRKVIIDWAKETRLIIQSDSLFALSAKK